MNNPFDVTHNAREFTCNNCGAGLCLENWQSEYGEPIDGEYDVRCPDCSNEFMVSVETRTQVRLLTV